MFHITRLARWYAVGAFAVVAFGLSNLAPALVAQEQRPARPVQQARPAAPARVVPQVPPSEQPPQEQTVPVEVPATAAEPAKAPTVPPAPVAAPMPVATPLTIVVVGPTPLPVPVAQSDAVVSPVPTAEVDPRTTRLVIQTPRPELQPVAPPSEQLAATQPWVPHFVRRGSAGPIEQLLTDSSDFPAPNPSILPRDHPAVGSYFGKAMQVCAAGVAPSACAGGVPAGVLFMTPTLTSDGLFVADDSYTFQDPPFGPHATAHGSWTPTSATEFTAEYVFMTKPYPPKDGFITGVRARWVAKVIDANTLVGWVNAYFLSAVPTGWSPLAVDQFPGLPTESAPFYTAPSGFITDPGTCLTAGCPQVFKFTLKRIVR